MEQKKQEQKKTINNYFYKDVHNVVNGDYHVHGNVVNDKEVPHSESIDHVSKEVMGRAILAVQDLFWGQSAYAVIFCAMRDFFNYEDNATLFEGDIDELSSEMKFEYLCPANTISSSFYNNSYLKLHVSKWGINNVKPRSIRLLNEFKDAVVRELAVT